MESITKPNKFFGHLAGQQRIAKLNDTGNIKVVYVAITLDMQKNFCTVIRTSIKFLAKIFLFTSYSA